MPTLELTPEELVALTHLAANASGPGITWLLTNPILLKCQTAQQQQMIASNGQTATPPRPNREDHP